MTPDQLLQEGLRLHQAGQLAQADALYRQLLALQPGQPDVLHYLGLLAYQERRFADAVGLIGQSVAAQAGNSAAHSNLGNALAMLGRHAEAAAAFRSALALDPQFVDAWFNLGNCQREQGQFADADAAYRHALALRPQHLGALNNLANLLLARQRSAEAAEAFHFLGNALQDAGRTADAANAYRQSIALAPSAGVETQLAFLTPSLPMSVAEIDRTREQLFAGIASLTARGIRLADPLRYASGSIFYTGYHGRDDRELRQRFADFYLSACPELAWRAPHCAGYAGSGKRIRIGFISRNFLPEHPMTKLFGGVIEHLDRRRFDVTMFRIGAAGASQAYADTQVTVLADDPAAGRQAIAQARLDVLFYTDVGMEPTSYFLAFSRLAPVQCVTFGHPVTTGIGNIDYFLSSRDMDTRDAQAHYTETLVRLAMVPIYFRRPSAAANPPTRASLGLAADARLYFCAQNLIKFHPDFDAVLADILRRDPRGLLVLIDSRGAPVGRLLLERFRQSMPDAANRIVFLPFLKLDALLGFLPSVDAILDTPSFGGGTTSLEFFAVDAPVLTWPGPFARSRITHALYRQMQLDGLEAGSASEYTDMALRLAQDRPWREAFADALRQKKHVLYDNLAPVREIERFLVDAVAAAAQGRKLRDWPADHA